MISMSSKYENVMLAVHAIDDKMARLEYRRGQLIRQAEKLAKGQTKASSASHFAESTMATVNGASGPKIQEEDIVNVSTALATNVSHGEFQIEWRSLCQSIAYYCENGGDPTNLDKVKEVVPQTLVRWFGTQGWSDQYLGQLVSHIASRLRSKG